MNAIDKIEKASKDGQIRRFTGNDYVRDMLKGDRSRSSVGRATRSRLQADNPNVKHEPAGARVHDLHRLHAGPVGAPHAFTAEKIWTSCTTRRSQAEITKYVNYVPPVKGTKELS